MRVLFVFLAICNALFLWSQNAEDSKWAGQMDSLVHAYYQPSTPGIAIAVIKQGELSYSKQIGMANLEYGIAISDSTAFHIASVSKQFTAFLAVLLERDGKLSLTDDLRTHITELSHLPDKISLKQLLNHTHGLPNLFELAHLNGFEVADRLTHREIVEMLLKIKQVNFKPGAKYEYNNTGYVLMAEVIERVMGESFRTVLEKKVLGPLNMNTTRAIDRSSELVKNKAASYRFRNGQYEHNAFNIRSIGSSGMSTTISDLSKWAIYFQQPNEEAKAIFRKMQIPTILTSGETLQYGLGLEWKNYKGLDVVFHGGGDGSYRAYILHVPKYQFSLVVLGNNNDFAPLQLGYDVVDVTLSEYQKEEEPYQKTTYTTEELKAFEGIYEFAPGAYYNILAERDTLYFQAYGTSAKLPLPVLGDKEFLFPYYPTSKFVFHDGGFRFHIADFKYPCTKVELRPPNVEAIDLEALVGVYRNKEFNTSYQLILKENQLIAKHGLDEGIPLYPLEADSFYSPYGYFGRLDFLKNGQGIIIGFKVSGQNLRNIEFKKLK